LGTATSWDKVFNAVEHVTVGLEHRALRQIDAIGVAEILGGSRQNHRIVRSIKFF
jgi:hypothetical protein